MANEWLRYANQGATRRLPLNNDLVNALSFLPDLGVTMEVFSGGQPEKGEGPRVGSTRHDHGNAADVFFYKDGRRLDWNDPQDQPLYQDIVRKGKERGLTGFGAGPGYMQPGSMHIGFGNPGVWGAGGSGRSAPSWLAEAYGGAPDSKPMPTYSEAMASKVEPTIANMQNKSFDPIGEVMGSAAPRAQSPQVASSPSSTAPTVSAQGQPGIPAAAQALAGGTAPKSMADIFGMMAMAPQQSPQFSPVQIAGPSQGQSTALLQLVQALKQRVA